MSYGPFSPDTREAFTVSPEVVYSPIVPVWGFVTNRFDPHTAMPLGSANPEDQGGVYGSSRRGVFANRAGILTGTLTRDIDVLSACGR